MPRFSASILLATAGLLTAGALDAQEKLGVNLRLNRTQQVGVTWHRSPGFAIRPALTAGWSRTEAPFGPDVETTLLGLDLDFLFKAAAWGRVTSYYGLGASLIHISSDGDNADAWLARALLGARVTLVERVALFGEVGVEYQGSDSLLGERVALATFPIGVIVFLK